MSSPDQTGSRSPDPDPAEGPAPDVGPDPAGGVADAASVQAARGEAPAGRATAFERGSAEAVLPLLVGLAAILTLLLLAMILRTRDGSESHDSAPETYSELRSMSYSAGWKTDSEIYSVQASLDRDLYSLDSGLRSVGLDLGSLAYDVGSESRPRVREVEDAVDAHRDELRQFRRSVDARFDELRDSVEARLGGIEDAADAALDDHWAESRRRSRNSRTFLGPWWFLGIGTVVSVLVGWWAYWRESRALAQPAEGM